MSEAKICETDTNKKSCCIHTHKIKYKLREGNILLLLFFWTRKRRTRIRVASVNIEQYVLFYMIETGVSSRMDYFLVCMVKINTNSERASGGSWRERESELKMINYLAFINNREINYIFLTFFTGVLYVCVYFVYSLRVLRF